MKAIVTRKKPTSQKTEGKYGKPRGNSDSGKFKNTQKNKKTVTRDIKKRGKQKKKANNVKYEAHSRVTKERIVKKKSIFWPNLKKRTKNTFRWR